MCKIIAVKPKSFIVWVGKSEECDEYYENVIDFLDSSNMKKMQWWSPLNGISSRNTKQYIVKVFLQYLDSIGYKNVNNIDNIELILNEGISIKYIE